MKHPTPPRHTDSLAPDYRRGRPLRLRAGGLQRRATAPPCRCAARGALRFSGPVLGRRPLALFALGWHPHGGKPLKATISTQIPLPPLATPYGLIFPPVRNSARHSRGER